MATNRAKRIANHAYHKFLAEPTFGDEGGESCWIVVDEEEVGMDVTYHLVREYVRDYSQQEDPELDIPYDTLPTRPAVNPESGRDVWVISQPDHIATAEVTMQGGVGFGQRQDLNDGERTLAEHFGAMGVEQKYSLDQTDKEPTGQHVGLILMDQEWPMWSELLEHVGEDTEIIATDRVEEPEPPEDAEPTKNRYEPENG